MWVKLSRKVTTSSNATSSSDDERETHYSLPPRVSTPASGSRHKIRPSLSISTLVKLPRSLAVPSFNHGPKTAGSSSRSLSPGPSLSPSLTLSPSPSPSPSPFPTPSKKRISSAPNYSPFSAKAPASERTARRFSTPDVTSSAQQFAIQLQNTQSLESKIFKNHPGPYHFPEIFPLSSPTPGIHVGLCRPGPRSVSDWLFIIAQNIVPEGWEKDPKANIHSNRPFPPPNGIAESTRDHFGHLMNRNHGFEGVRAIQNMTRRLIFGELRVTKISVLRSAPVSTPPEKNGRGSSGAAVATATGQKEEPSYYLLVHISHCPGAGSVSSSTSSFPPRPQSARSAQAQPRNDGNDVFNDREKSDVDSAQRPLPKLHWKTPELFKIMQVRRCPPSRLEREGHKLDNWSKHGDKTIPWANFVCPEYVTTANVDQLQQHEENKEGEKRKEKKWWSPRWRDSTTKQEKETVAHEKKSKGKGGQDKSDAGMKVGMGDTGVYEVEFSEYPSFAQFVCVACYLHERINQVDYRMDGQGVWFADTIVAVMERLGRVIRIRKGEWSMHRDMRVSVGRIMTSSTAAGGLRLPGREDEAAIGDLISDLPTILREFRGLVNTFLEKRITHGPSRIDI
ncbi:hypothetical protein AX16_008477 [Volvariella volvacea WC 439]|nr:hypothetical protein AX16_008477 [Volvariella volvacea WC 439]